MRTVLAILLIVAVYALAGVSTPGGPAKRLYTIDELVPPTLVGQEV